MAESKVRTIRVSDDKYDELLRKYGSLGAALEAALAGPEYLPEVRTEPVDSEGPVVKPLITGKRGGRTRDTWPYPEQVRRWETLMLPVGDVISGKIMWTWPLNRMHHREITRLFEPWEAAGFVLVWGPGQAEASQCPNSRLQPYFPGDREVWCDLRSDADLGECLTFLRSHPQVLVPMMIDLDRYSSSPLYKLICDLYSYYFRQYLLDGKPVDLEFED